MTNGVNLTAAQQDWFAEVCIKAVEIKWKSDTGKDLNFQELGEWFASHIVDGNLQSDGVFSRLYDTLHRTGANQ